MAAVEMEAGKNQPIEAEKNHPKRLGLAAKVAIGLAFIAACNPAATPRPTDGPTQSPDQTPSLVPTLVTSTPEIPPTPSPTETPTPEPSQSPELTQLEEIQQAAAAWLLPEGDPNRMEPAFRWNRGGDPIPLGLDTTTKPVNGKYDYYLYGVELIEKFNAAGQAGVLTLAENPNTGTRVIELFRVSAADDYMSVFDIQSTILAGSPFEGHSADFNTLSWDPQENSLIYFKNWVADDDYGGASLTQAVHGAIDNSITRAEFSMKLAKGIDTPQADLPTWTWTNPADIQLPKTLTDWDTVPMFYTVAMLQTQAPTPTPTT